MAINYDTEFSKLLYRDYDGDQECWNDYKAMLATIPLHGIIEVYGVGSSKPAWL